MPRYDSFQEFGLVGRPEFASPSLQVQYGPFLKTSPVIKIFDTAVSPQTSKSSQTEMRRLKYLSGGTEACRYARKEDWALGIELLKVIPQRSRHGGCLATGTDVDPLSLFAMNVLAHDSEEITPPSSLRGLPLTPPPTDEKGVRDTSYILRQITRHRSGDTGQTILKVDKRVWIAVNPLLLRDDKLRFDYSPSIERLVLRMPTRVHEQFSRSLSGRISEQLRLLSSGVGSAADFAKDIRDVGSATIRPRDPEYGTHDPDSSFQHLESPSPTVIIEVAHSQRGGKLRSLAEEYILGSDLEIRVVVGVDIEYSKCKRATFSIWRARMQGPDDDKVWVVEAIVANQIFRYDDGKPNVDQDAGLRLHLEDFADQKTYRQFEDVDRDIFVSCGELYQYLKEAEAIAKTAESTEPVRNPRLKKRRRTQTPEEQLDDYAVDEEHVSKRQDLDDSSYKESSSECI